ncbi:MAG: efflux RND transporter periplasmic adaptor subunit [Terriglobales bacterium]
MKLNRKRIIVVGLLVIAFIGLLIMYGHKAKANQEDPQQIRPAAVAVAQKRPLSDAVTLSGEFRPFQEVDVHAKVAGYIRVIHVDVGDHVREGQIMAVLEVPELRAELQGADAVARRSKDAVRRAKSDLLRAQSVHEAAHLNYTRLNDASATHPGIIAQQELDDAEAKDKESEAQISAAEAALSEAENQLGVAVASQQQYTALADYTNIIAPFDGVVTKRYADTGALVQAGTSSSTQAMPVVRVAETDVFRLILPVPESAVPQVHLGNTVQVRVPALNRDFEGKVARFADAVDQDTRTMHTEVDVRNPNRSLVQGMYAEIKLTLEKKDNALSIPIQAVNRNGSQATVLVVNSQDRIEERDVRLGMEGANEIEVVSGLNPMDRVVIGSRSEFRPGDRVSPRVIAANKETEF